MLFIKLYKWFSFRLCFILAGILFFIASCQTVEEELGDEPAILKFSIEKVKNPSLPKDYSGIIDGTTYSIITIFDGDFPVTSLIPTITLPKGATVKPDPSAGIDFTNPVRFTVTSASGKTSAYTVSVSLPSREPVISTLGINDAISPFDKVSSSFFYAVAENDRNGSKFFCTGQHIAELMVDGNKVSNGGSLSLNSFEAGKTITITPLNSAGTPGKSVKVVLTALPLVSITVSSPIVNEPKRECHISIIDPTRKTNKDQLWFPSHRAGIEIRGGLAQAFPKKSYSFEFWMPDRNEEKEEGTSLFGIRNDGDWILDAMYVDRARMRNRLSMDIWTAISKVPHITPEPTAVNGSRGYFVELFINGAYEGLYCLSDRVDRKQLKLDFKEGFSYKGSQWSLATEFISGDAAYNNSSGTWDGWELEYQGENGAAASPMIKWEPLRDFIRFTANATNTLFSSDLEKKIDMNNLVDYLLFTNAMGADDNTGKNSFFSVYNNSQPAFFITAWDLDATWGRKWNGNLIDLRDGEFIGVTGTLRSNSRYCRPNAFFQRTMLQNPSNIKQKMKVRWQELRSSELSKNRLTNRVEEYRKHLLNSGAYERERIRWPGSTSELNSETTFMLSWMENRLRQVDDIVNGL